MQNNTRERRAAMSVADLRARTHQIFDMFNTHDPHAAAAHFAEDAELRDVAVAQPAIGPVEIAAVYARQIAAIPDSHVRVDRIVAESDTVAVEWTLSGTHRGRLMGIPATGKPVSFKGISLLRFRQNMVIADTRVWDLAGLLRQIGLLPGQE
jgi:steroid delta-isomerase-like uncharacterized protein